MEHPLMEGILMDLQWLAQFGFAAVVAMFVLWRLEPALRDQTRAITLLTIVVSRISNQDYEDIAKSYGLTPNGGGD